MFCFFDEKGFCLQFSMENFKQGVSVWMFSFFQFCNIAEVVIIHKLIWVRGDQKDLCIVLWNMHGGGVNKLEMKCKY
jgi:hypothetical protein